MKTCKMHGYNPPSKCPNCKIHRRRAKHQAAKKGWQTRKETENAAKKLRIEEQKKKLQNHGWLS